MALMSMAGRLYASLPLPVRRVLVALRAGRSPVGVVLVVLNPRSQVLVLRHHHRKAGADWGLPTGLAHRRESTPLAAARRELREETGIVDATLREVELDQLGLDPIKYREHWFLGSVEGEQVTTGHEIAEARWIGLKEAQRLLPNDRQRRALQGISDSVDGPQAGD